MRAFWWFVVGVVAVTGATGAGQPPGPRAPTVHVTRLVVERPFPGESNPPPSTQIKLFVDCPGKVIVGLDHAKSRLDSLTDDTGTDLTKGRFPAGVLNNSEVTPLGNGSACVFLFYLPGRPAAGARRITIKGVMALTCGKAVATAEAKNVGLKKGAEFKVGPVPVRIFDVDNAGVARLAYGGDGPVVKEVHVFDDKGKAVRTVQTGGLVPLAGPYKTPTPSLAILQKVESVDIKITYYSETEVVSIPLDLTFGLGLEP